MPRYTPRSAGRVNGFTGETFPPTRRSPGLPFPAVQLSGIMSPTPHQSHLGVLVPTPDDAAAPARPEYHDDWHPSGWGHVLPRHQASALSTLFATAARRHMTGTIDEIHGRVLAELPPAVFESMPTGLDTPVTWLEPEDLDGVDDPDEETRIRAWVADHETTLTAALGDAGLPVPSTVRELAEVMVALGIAAQTDGAWTMPTVLPRPENVLPLTSTRSAALARLREMQKGE